MRTYLPERNDSALLSSFLLAVSLLALGCSDEGGLQEPASSGGSSNNMAEVTGGSGGATMDPLPGAGGMGSSEPSEPDPCGQYLFDLTDPQAGPTTPTPIAPGEWDFIREMFVMGSDVYTLSKTAISVVRGDSTSREVITTEVPELPAGYPSSSSRRFIVDATHAYIATDAGIARVGLSDGIAEELYVGAESNETTSDLHIEGSDVFFALNPRGIFRMPLDGSSEPIMVTDALEELGFVATSIGVLGQQADGTLASVPVTGGDATFFADPAMGSFADTRHMSSLDGTVYWVTGGRILSCSLVDCNEFTQYEIPGSDGVQVKGGRVFGATDALAWTSLDGSRCGNLVFGEWPDDVSSWVATDDFVFLAGDPDYRSAFEPSNLLRLPLD